MVDFYHQNLLNSPEAQAWLEKRGLNHPELVSHFTLGYAGEHGIGGAAGVLPPPFTREGKALRERLSFRSELSGDKKEPEMQVRYYISPADISAEKFAAVMEGHWSIENKLHWRLDVAMNEDDCRIRRGDAAELFSRIRHITVNILSANKEFKAGLSRKMHRAAMDRKYLTSVLAGCGVS